MLHCVNCGTPNDDASKFCGSCGNDLKPAKDQKPASQPEQQPPPGYQQQPPPGYQQPPPGHQQPPPGYQQAPPGYQQQAPPGFQQPPPGYQQPPPGFYPAGYKPPRTGWLTYVIVMNWIGIGIGVLGALMIFAFAAAWEDEFDIGGSFFAAFGFIVLVFVGLFAWMTVSLNNYSNTARIINIVLIVLGLLSSLGDLANGFLGLILGGLALYALAFDKPTIALFKPYQQIDPYQQRY
ncbi:MAG: zinc ribbon domain-containing protein [Candidatus Kariarchaeaceae archaeon]